MMANHSVTGILPKDDLATQCVNFDRRHICHMSSLDNCHTAFTRSAFYPGKAVTE